MQLPHSVCIVVGIPFCGRNVAPEWAISLACIGYPLAANVTFVTLKGMEVGEARNHIVEEALQKGAKYVWFIDDDTAPPSFSVRRLLYALEQNPDAMVCGGIYVTKDPIQPEPCVFKENGMGAFWQWKVGEIFECAGLGTGCMLIRTDLFKHLEKPYFKTVDADCDGSTPEFKFQQTDDLYFCEKVKAAGFKILAHGGVLPIHWDADKGVPYMLPADSYPLKEQKAVQKAEQKTEQKILEAV